MQGITETCVAHELDIYIFIIHIFFHNLCHFTWNVKEDS